MHQHESIRGSSWMCDWWRGSHVVRAPAEVALCGKARCSECAVLSWRSNATLFLVHVKPPRPAEKRIQAHSTIVRLQPHCYGTLLQLEAYFLFGDV